MPIQIVIADVLLQYHYIKFTIFYSISWNYFNYTSIFYIKLNPENPYDDSTSWTPGVGLEPCNYIRGFILFDTKKGEQYLIFLNLH